MDGVRAPSTSESLTHRSWHQQRLLHFLSWLAKLRFKILKKQADVTPPWKRLVTPPGQKQDFMLLYSLYNNYMCPPTHRSSRRR